MDMPLESDNVPAGETASTIALPRERLPLAEAMARFEKKYLETLLAENKWRRNKVAAQLNIDRRTLFRKMKTHGID